MIKILFKPFVWLFGEGFPLMLKDWRFWLLLFAINTSGNLGLYYYISEPISLILITVILLFSFKPFDKKENLYVIGFATVYFLQCIILTRYQLVTTLHHYQQIVVAIMLAKCLGANFFKYFSSIIILYAIISLVCFALQWNGFVIPYTAAEVASDGDDYVRVSNLYYTQLGNGTGLAREFLRNCGPFWEPGAYQGFLNLSLFYLIITFSSFTKQWCTKIAILVVTIITTFSTGGYIAFFVNVCIFLYINKGLSGIFKVVLALVFAFISYYYYTTLAFMQEKITGDQGRMGFSFEGIDDIGNLILGYGYDVESFSKSSLYKAGSIVSTFNYTGLVGGIILFIGMILNRCQYRLFYFVIMFVILMNEPFLVNSFIFWGLPFVIFPLIDKGNNHKVS